MSTPESTNPSSNDTVVAEAAQTPQYIDIMQRLAYLEDALLQQDPRMRDHLKEIHRNLIQHEELVHLLKEEEIAKIMQAQQVITNTTLIAEVSSKKGRAAANKKAANLSLGDL